MGVKIVQKTEREYLVNGKRVNADMEGNWIGQEDMTTAEVSAFQRHILRTDESILNKAR